MRVSKIARWITKMYLHKLKKVTMKQRKFRFSIILLLFFSSVLFSQSIYSTQDSLICAQKFSFADYKNLNTLPFDSVFINVTKSFIGTEYQPKTIETPNSEQLKVHLSGLDCYTFIETSLALARVIKSGRTTFPDFVNEVKKIRYRNGILNGWTSRLHYFSDWIYDLSRRNILRNVTKSIGGIPYRKKIDFMSTHPAAYPMLANSRLRIDSIRQVEENISARSYYYIPENLIEQAESKINTGDILGITTDIKGLDISHTAIAVRLSNGRIHILHAPNVRQKVQISKLPLSDYIKSHKHQTGIMVARPLTVDCSIKK
jgi:cell wall-associated NlpC family hydrolase